MPMTLLSAQNSSLCNIASQYYIDVISAMTNVAFLGMVVVYISSISEEVLATNIGFSLLWG